MTERRPRPEVPCPERIRSISGAFGWLDARLLHEGWLGRLGPEALGALVFLVLAADRRGGSYYGRERMARILGVERRDLDRGLARLLELGLVAHRPWSRHQRDCQGTVSLTQLGDAHFYAPSWSWVSTYTPG